MIPKLIHIIWWQGLNNIPEKFKKNINTWKHHNKNYKIILWDELKLKQFIKENYKNEWSNVEKYNFMIQKIDYCKYLLLYYYGGVYVDIDIYCNDSLDKYLIQDKINVAYMPLIKFYKLINNGFIGVEKNNKLILKVIKECRRQRDSYFINKEFTVLKTTGPYLFNSILNNNNKVNIFDQSIIYEIDSKSYSNINNGKLGVHCHEFSWISSYLVYMINIVMFCNRNFFKFILVLILVLLLAYFYLPNRLFLF